MSTAQVIAALRAYAAACSDLSQDTPSRAAADEAIGHKRAALASALYDAAPDLRLPYLGQMIGPETAGDLVMACAVGGPVALVWAVELERQSGTGTGG